MALSTFVDMAHPTFVKFFAKEFVLPDWKQH